MEIANRSPSPQPSPAGRGGAAGRAGAIGALLWFAAARQVLPLPAGEGWGEGENVPEPCTGRMLPKLFRTWYYSARRKLDFTAELSRPGRRKLRFADEPLFPRCRKFPCYGGKRFSRSPICRIRADSVVRRARELQFQVKTEFRRSRVS